ncbi:hypothetical protein [Ruminococcus flavefaciens]|uniref:hypothetical protein n=1 Tax=Ruminococcus flavefaciens TaxID=1265 RepID=UPI0026F021E1|nr:hypothetical protein [Ruminococcus flavefaciens]
MDKIATIQSFFSQFLPAYEENALPSQPERPAYPYITYEGIFDDFGETDTSMTFSTWYREFSWVNSVLMTNRISKGIPRPGLMLPCDEGYVLIMKSSPFGTRMGDDSDDLIKRTVFNITVRFYTND